MIAPTGCTRASPAAAARASTSSVTDALSFTGFVFGIAQTAVKPPATAARAPVATVSLYSCPGSRRCTCRSMNPGVTHLPRASIPRASRGCLGALGDLRHLAVPEDHRADSVRPARRDR